jgi:2-dehydro-3-deoxyphosphooctonate aldolase (KDO 8-P synthase)
VLEIADELADICQRLRIEYVVKPSFDKANRSSGQAFRGPGAEEGVAILQEVRERFALPVLTDSHESQQAATAVQVVAELAEFGLEPRRGRLWLQAVCMTTRKRRW